MRPWGLIAAFCGAHLLSMTSFSVIPALAPHFAQTWRLSPTALGWLNGVMFLGYFLATPILATATDRIDPRRIYFWSALVGAGAQLWFAYGAEGLASALAPRLLAGAALAGGYMPGLKALTDRLPAETQPRATALYTACFALGASNSFLLTGWLGPMIGWRGLFYLGAVGALAAGGLIGLVAAPQAAAPPAGRAAAGLLIALRDRRFRGWALCYGCHCAEQFGWRAWAVAYLLFVAARHDASPPLDPTVAVAAAVALAAPASVLGGELAQRWGRRRYLLAAMGASAAAGAAAGCGADWPLAALMAAMLLHALLLNADSAAMTSGLIAETPSERRGAALALYSMAGFLGAFIGPALFGAILDLVGDLVGATTPLAWSAAYAALALVVLLGAWAAWTADR